MTDDRYESLSLKISALEDLLAESLGRLQQIKIVLADISIMIADLEGDDHA